MNHIRTITYTAIILLLCTHVSFAEETKPIMLGSWRAITIACMAGFAFGVAIYNLFKIQSLSNRLCDIEDKLADMESDDSDDYT